MKQNILLLTFFAVFCFFQSCSPNSERVVTPKELVSSGHMISLPVDGQTSNVSDGLVYYQDENGSWLLNLSFNEIQLYDLESKTLKKRIQYPLEGPKGVDYILSIHVQSLDSIFLFGYPTLNLHLTDTSGVIKKKYEFEPPEGYTPPFLHNAFYDYKPLIKEDKLLIIAKFPANIAEVTSDQLASKRLGYTIDLRNSEVELLPITWPASYNAAGPKLLDFGFAATDEIIVFSLAADHNLYVTDLEGNLLKSVTAKSQYLDEMFDHYPESGVQMATGTYLFASGRYERIRYDRYRDVFYRFVFPKVEVTSEEELAQLRRFPQKLAIMILDKELNVIGETLLPENIYYPGNSFVGKEGLYISTGHPDNLALQEELMIFDILKLEELKEEK